VVDSILTSHGLGRLVKGQRVKLEETRHFEFKDIPPNSKKPISDIVEKVERYVVAFLNAEGGSIFWGINDDGIAIGVGLDYPARNRLRTEVSNKLAHIQPSSAWTPASAKVELHPVFAAPEALDPLADQHIVEVAAPATGGAHAYLTQSGECYQRTDGGIQRLNGDQLLRLIYERQLRTKLEAPSEAAATNYWGFASVMRRIERIPTVLAGANLLWVDDQPEGNLYERVALSELGAQIDLALSTSEALLFLQRKKYHAVISDMRRGAIPDEGLRMVQSMPAGTPPVVFYILDMDRSRGTPPDTFGITNRPDELLHLLLDVLERTRL
jgi:hypothetical protein